MKIKEAVEMGMATFPFTATKRDVAFQLLARLVSKLMECGLNFDNFKFDQEEES